MKGRFLIRTIGGTATLAMLAVATVATANEQQTEPDSWQSFDNHSMMSSYAQSIQSNRKQLRSNLKYVANSALNSAGITDRSARYVGSAISLATQDATIHLNDSKTLSLDLLDVNQSDRALFFGYKKSW